MTGGQVDMAAELLCAGGIPRQQAPAADAPTVEKEGRTLRF